MVFIAATLIDDCIYCNLQQDCEYSHRGVTPVVIDPCGEFGVVIGRRVDDTFTLSYAKIYEKHFQDCTYRNPSV